MLEAGVYAGLTIVIALIITMVICKLLIGVIVPSNNMELLKFLAIAFISGFIIDKLIYKLKIFGNTLDEYYKEAGSGFWGALSFVFSIAISYLIMQVVIKNH
jgi:ABC-type bacteriocin/lantibiotic exporter with double-glycine peptidase domain